MGDVVEISDDEDSHVPENDVGISPKVESLDSDVPPQNLFSRLGVNNEASSSGTSLRSSFIGMGFVPSLVDRVIEENGEENAELLLETLITYSDIQQPKTKLSDDVLFSRDIDDLSANRHSTEAFHKSESSDSLDSLFSDDSNKNVCRNGDFPLKEEPDIQSGICDEKVASLLKMNFSLDEVGFAIDRLGKDASISQLMDFIFATRMAKRHRTNAFSGDEENKEDCDNEALFCIMEKTLRLLEMDFTENQISAAFEKCGSDATLAELADSIFAPGSGTTAYKHYGSLKRKIGDCLDDCPLNSIYIKTEEFSSNVGSQVGTSRLVEQLKGKMPKEEYIEQPNNFKKPMDEFTEDSSSSFGWMWPEARRESSTSTNNGAASSCECVAGVGSLEEDRKPSMPMSNPCKSLNSARAKPPYFLYGNVTNLSLDSWAKISQFLYSFQPEFVKTELFSALSRTEGYVHNLPIEDRVHVLKRSPMTIQEALPHTRKWWPSWDTRKQLSFISCETSRIPQLCGSLGRMLAESKGVLSSEQQRHILEQCQTKNLVWVGSCQLAPIEPEQLESIMGYPSHHSWVAGMSLSERLKSLKLSFQTDTLGYHLSVLKPLCPEGLSVLSFFSGIGGAEVALHRLGIRLKGVVSVEPCERRRRILRRWWENTAHSGELVQIESVQKLSSSKLENMIKKFGGFDLLVCQNPYSGAESDSLAGLDFSMFAEFVRVLQHVRSSMDRNR